MRYETEFASREFFVVDEATSPERGLRAWGLVTSSTTRMSASTAEVLS